MGLVSGLLHAQVTVATEAEPTKIDVRRAEALLDRLVTVNVSKATLRQAIDAIAASADVHMPYNNELLAAYPARVTLQVRQVSLRAALAQVLSGTRLRVIPLSNGGLGLQEGDGESLVIRAGGIITGTVVNAATKQPLSGVIISVDDSIRSVRTDESGRYHLRGIKSGNHRLTARMVGFARRTKLVTVIDDSTVVVDLALAVIGANVLDQVVVTATGQQRYRELGHVVAQINADSLVREAPIASVSELLQSRVPGLQVLTSNGGIAGGEISLRLRGVTTFNLDPEPIVVVDGVRYTSNNLVLNGDTQTEDRRGRGELRSPLNDINPNDIATIEVVKGPSASTLYGPDAANGVIVITTKRGQPGKTQFRWYVRPVQNDVPKTRIARGYRAWGHDSSGVLFPGNCSVLDQYAAGLCILDSITVAPTVLDNDAYSILAKSRPAWQYGASVSGGPQALRYFLSGNYDSQIGALQVPPAAQQYLKSLLGVSSLGDAIKTPNTLRTIGVHANVATDVTSKGNISLTTNYSQTAHRSADASYFANQYGSGAPHPGIDTTNVFNYLDPTFSLQTTEEQASRLTGALSGTLQTMPWLTTNGSMGLDLSNGITHSLLPAGELYPDDGGVAEDDRRASTGRTLTFGATALGVPNRLSFRSSVGVQYTYAHLDGLTTTGYGLAPGSTSISTAQQVQTSQLWDETVTLGTYGEEVIGFNDRLFLTGSLRMDGATSLGDAYHPHPYPKAGLSWIASDEPFLKGIPGIDELRFRYSYGAASRYPTSGMKLGQVYGYATPVEGQSHTIFGRSSLANPLLRPERTREAEYGADLTMFGGVRAGLSWFTRRTTDELQRLSNPTGLPPIWGNVASVRAHGFEATVDIPVADTRYVRANMGFTYAYNTNTVLSLGDAKDRKDAFGSGFAVGYPLGAVFGQPIIGVADTVGGHADGIIFPQEVVRDSVVRFLGVIVPPRTYTLTPQLSVFNGHVRMSALFDRQTEFLQSDIYAQNCSSNGLCLAPFLTTTPPLIQARFAASNDADFLEPGDFTRWREMNVTADLPQAWLRIIHFPNATVSLQGRNLALWTKYHGVDPESRDLGFSSASANGIPQARTWSVRFDVTP